MAKRLPRRRTAMRSDSPGQFHPRDDESLSSSGRQRHQVPRPPSFRDFRLAWTTRISGWQLRLKGFITRLAAGGIRVLQVGAFLLLVLACAMTVGFIQASRVAPTLVPFVDRGTLLRDLASLQTIQPENADQRTASGSPAPRFADLPAPSPNEQGLLAKGLMKGFPDGRFRPEITVSRGEALSILARFITAQEQPFSILPNPKPSSFADIRSKHWLTANLSVVSAYGLISGLNDPELGPDRPLTSTDWASLTAPLRSRPSDPLATALLAGASEAARLPFETQARLRSLLNESTEETPAWNPAAVAKKPNLEPIAEADDVPLLEPVPVAGCIVDGLSGRRLVQATLLIGSHTVILQPDGGFRVPGFRDQFLEMTAYCEGYQPLTLKHRVGFKPGPVVFGLKPALTVFQGEIIDAGTGLPIAGASITVGTRKTITDAQGRFRVPGLSPTWHQIVCRAPGFMDSVELIFVKTSDPSRVFKLRGEGGTSPTARQASPARRRTTDPDKTVGPTMDISAGQGYSEYLEARE